MPKTVVTFLFFTAVVLASLPVRGQSFSVGYTYFPYSRLKQVSGTPSPDAPTHLSVYTLQTSISYPLVFNQGRTRLENTVAYQYVKFDYRGTPSPLESVQSYSYTAFFSHEFLCNWGIIAVAAPAYADDFHGPASTDAITLTLVLAGTYRFSDDFKLGLGAALENVFGEAMPLPVVSIEWTITEQFWLKSILPVNLELTYLPISQIGLRATVAVSGNHYHGDTNRYPVKNPQLNYSAVTGDLGVRWFILPWLHLTVHGGATFYRRYEFSDGRKSVAKYDPSNCLVFQVDLGVGE